MTVSADFAYVRIDLAAVGAQLFLRSTLTPVLPQLANIAVPLVNILPNIATIAANLSRISPDLVTIRTQFTTFRPINALRRCRSRDRQQ
jgi:hypothetical protein